MQKLKVKYFFLGGILFGPILAFLLLSLRGVGEKPDADYVAIEKATRAVHCPDGATMEYQPWGKSGRMGKCQLAHGAFIAAENGDIVFKGEYSMGKLISEEKAR